MRISIPDIDNAARARVMGRKLAAKARGFIESEVGASAAEYALILALVAGILVAALTNVINAIGLGINVASNYIIPGS